MSSPPAVTTAGTGWSAVRAMVEQKPDPTASTRRFPTLVALTSRKVPCSFRALCRKRTAQVYHPGPPRVAVHQPGETR